MLKRTAKPAKATEGSQKKQKVADTTADLPLILDVQEDAAASDAEQAIQDVADELSEEFKEQVANKDLIIEHKPADSSDEEDADRDLAGYDTDELEALDKEIDNLLPNINKYLDMTRDTTVPRTPEGGFVKETYAQLSERLSSISRKSGTVFLANIPRGFYEDQLFSYFSQFGTVTGVYVPRKKRTSNFKQVAFVQFEVPDVAKIAAEAMHGYMMFNCVIRASYMEPERVPALTFARRRPLKTLEAHNAEAVEKANRGVSDAKVAQMRLIGSQLKRQAALEAKGISIGSILTEAQIAEYRAWVEETELKKQADNAASNASNASNEEENDN